MLISRISYNPVAEQDFQQSVFDVLYSTTTAPSSTRTSTLSSFHPHSLAVFFLVVATGSLFGEQPFARTVSEQYYALARAAYSLKSVVVESSLVSMQALHMVIIYKYYTERSASNTGWLLGGLSCRIAQTVRVTCFTYCLRADDGCSLILQFGLRKYSSLVVLL